MTRPTQLPPACCLRMRGRHLTFVVTGPTTQTVFTAAPERGDHRGTTSSSTLNQPGRYCHQRIYSMSQNYRRFFAAPPPPHSYRCNGRRARMRCLPSASAAGSSSCQRCRGRRRRRIGSATGPPGGRKRGHGRPPARGKRRRPLIHPKRHRRRWPVLPPLECLRLHWPEDTPCGRRLSSPKALR